MSEWITPVFDRTSADVQYAKRYPESVSDLKGAYNASDLNRVNSNMLYIKEVFHSIGYTISLRSAERVWEMTDIPTVNDFEMYLTDVSTCRNKIPRYESTPGVPDRVTFNHDDANAIEKILYDIEELIRKIQAIYLYSNDLYCGEI